MSGIYGMSHRTWPAEQISPALKALSFWNRFYGSADRGSKSFTGGGVGIHVEHFSDTFPHGGTVLDHDGCHAVVDALLYNRDELTAQLSLPADSQLSDEELLLLLIRTHGFDALSLVNGDFAGAIYDPRTMEWTLFRDHLGVRPVFYYLDKDLFAFSTDIRGLAAVPGADISPNPEYIYRRAMSINNLSLCRTEYANIRGVRPGSYMVLRQTPEGFDASTHIYWRLKQKKIHFRTDAEYYAELRRLVTDAVQRRLDAIPGLVGAELSGGLDSGVIDILINRLGRKGVYYSWSLSPDALPLRQGADERKIILDICLQENIACKYADDAPAIDFWKLAAVPTPAHVDTLHMSDGSAWMRSRGARVVFSGHGGDEGVSHRCGRHELFHNREYPAYFKLYLQDLKGRKFAALRALRSGLKDAAKHKALLNTGYRYSSQNASTVLCGSFRERMAGSCANESLHFETEPHKYVEHGGSRPRLENAAYQGAINGVRYLFPYIDHRLMDFSLSIPRRLYISANRNRVIFREAFRDIIPQSLYTVSYKDPASQRDALPNSDPGAEFRDDFERFKRELDRDYWKGILDIDALEHITLPTEVRSPEYMQCVLVQNLLHRCILIQNVYKYAHRWSDCDE